MGANAVRREQQEAAEAELGEAVLAVGMVHPAGASQQPERARLDLSMRALVDATAWKGLNALMAVTADRVVLFKVSWTGNKAKGRVATWSRSDLRVTVEPRFKVTDVSLEVLSTRKRIDLEIDPKRDQPLIDELLALAVSTAGRSLIEFDADGKVSNINVPAGKWFSEQRGEHRYRIQRAPTLLQATELLRAIDAVRELTYYVVETPDGALARDTWGFYSEGPLNTTGLALVTPTAVSDTVASLSLTAYGDAMSSQFSVAHLKSQGRYANFVLLMECGRCGYKSPVETQPGPMKRQCYCCGAMNESSRAPISVFLGSSTIDI